jgi:hypothetical protein
MVDEAGRTMMAIMASVDSVVGMMGEIASASREQSAGIDQVNRAVVDMDETTQRNAAMVEQAAVAAASLDEQAMQLAQAVSVFKVRSVGSTAIGLTLAPERQAAVVRWRYRGQPVKRINSNPTLPP